MQIPYVIIKYLIQGQVSKSRGRKEKPWHHVQRE